MLADRWPEIFWAMGAAVAVALIFVLPDWEDPAMEIVWGSLAVLVAWRGTSVRRTRFYVLGGMCLFASVYVTVASPEKDELSVHELLELVSSALIVFAVGEVAVRYHTAREANARLADRERSLAEREREFFRSASHELRTPITIARGHAELCRVAATDETMRADLDIILDELARLTSASERMLLLATAEDPSFLRLGPVNVADLVARTTARWLPVAERAWTVRCDAQGYVEADERRLEVVLDVLLENAVHATSERDAINIRAFVRRDQLMVTISDNGAGIDPDELAGLFERPKLAPLSDRKRGTGIGLPCAAALVRSHGGILSVRSELGAGSTFTVELPGFSVSELKPITTTSVMSPST